MVILSRVQYKHWQFLYGQNHQVSDVRYPLSMNSIKWKHVIPGIGIAFLKNVSRCWTDYFSNSHVFIIVTWMLLSFTAL